MFWHLCQNSTLPFAKLLRYSVFYIMNFSFTFHLLPKFSKNKNKLVSSSVWEFHSHCKVCLPAHVINTFTSEVLIVHSHKQSQIAGKVGPFWILIRVCSEHFEVSWSREVLLWWSYSNLHIVTMGKRAPSKNFFVRNWMPWT